MPGDKALRPLMQKYRYNPKSGSGFYLDDQMQLLSTGLTTAAHTKVPWNFSFMASSPHLIHDPLFPDHLVYHQFLYKFRSILQILGKLWICHYEYSTGE